MLNILHHVPICTSILVRKFMCLFDRVFKNILLLAFINVTYVTISLLHGAVVLSKVNKVKVSTWRVTTPVPCYN